MPSTTSRHRVLPPSQQFAAAGSEHPPSTQKTTHREQQPHHPHGKADETMPELHHSAYTVSEAPTTPAHGKPPAPAARGCELNLILDDDTWAFRDTDDAPVTRRLRVWLDGNGGLIAIVTEAGTGTCITEAATEVHHHLTTVDYPNQRIRLFEHWPADTDEGSDEHFDEVLVDRSGEVTWLDTPAGPFTSMLRLPPPQESQNQQGRIARHRVFRCFDEGSVMITDPHGRPLGVLEFGASPGADQANGSHRLAAALLASATADDPADPELIPLFAQTVLAELPVTGWRLGDDQITGWLIAQSQRLLLS